jgi:hypothetical protein
MLQGLYCLFVHQHTIFFGGHLVQNKRQWKYKRNNERRSRNHCCQEAISITYFDCVSVALVMHQCIMQRVCAVLYCHVACPALTIFFHTIS